MLSTIEFDIAVIGAGAGATGLIMEALSLLFLGLVSGIVSGLAQGTTLALLVPPVEILVAYSYYKQGFIDFRVALLIAAGFLIGSLLGACFGLGLPDVLLRRVFAVFLGLLSVKMLF